MKPELIFTILILLIALLIGSGLKNFGSELLKVQKVEKVKISLATRFTSPSWPNEKERSREQH